LEFLAVLQLPDPVVQPSNLIQESLIASRQRQGDRVVRGDGSVLLFGTAGLAYNGFVSAGNYSYIGGPGMYHEAQGATHVFGYSAGQAADFAWHYMANNTDSVFVASGTAYSYMFGYDTYLAPDGRHGKRAGRQCNLPCGVRGAVTPVNIRGVAGRGARRGVGKGCDQHSAAGAFNKHERLIGRGDAGNHAVLHQLQLETKRAPLRAGVPADPEDPVQHLSPLCPHCPCPFE
jgi:hypothetical protein